MFGLFIIEAGSEPVAVLSGHDNKPLVFDTGSDAAAAARRCANGEMYTQKGLEAIKVQPRRLADDAWKARELGRFADGTYVALPWADLPKLSLTAEHYPHVSTIAGCKIAYTQDAAKGAGDIQTRVKPGRYLTQFYGDTYDAPTIARMAAEFSLQYGESLELKFAVTADEFERVYVNGPRSCMAYAAEHYSSSIHPVRVYAGFDVQLAYMERDGDITARALCWPAKKIYSRIYGDDCRLTDLFETHGYTSGSLAGAKITRKQERNGKFVIPYLDGLDGAEDDGDCLILGGSDICGDAQHGLSGSLYTCCSCYEGIDDEEDCLHDDSGQIYCDGCYSDRFSYCEHTEETCERDGMREVTVPNGRGGTTTQWWGEFAIDNDAFECEGTLAYFHNDLRVELADGTEWSDGYFEDNGFVCEGSGERYAYDDMVELEDGTCWCKDYFDDNGVTVDGKLYAKGDEPTVEDDGDTSEAPKPAHRFSPTCHCDAQIELALMPVDPSEPWRVVGPDSDGDYRIIRGPGEWSASYNNHYGFYTTLEAACEALKAKQSLDACDASNDLVAA